MFYDLNIALPDAAGKPGGRLSSAEWARVAQAVERAREFGYSVVALNQTVQGRLTAEHLAVWRTAPAFKDADLGWDAATGARAGAGAGAGAGAADRVRRGRIRVLRRVTAVVTDAAQGHSLASAGGATPAAEYDVVAVRPATEKILAAACSGVWDVDVVALDMGQRWGFVAKHKLVGQALAQGLALEISYRPALADSATRQQWVCNAAGLVRATRGRGLVWTSAARQALDLRTPYDVANLGEALQLNGDLSKRALSANARAVLLHGFTRAGTLRAVMSVRAPRPADADAADGAADPAGPAPKKMRAD
ncbi:RNA-binding RNA processing protein rpp1 [Coemansia javaensis]|uniref:RNA-binding RNA processing protein rpp1 n=1 Tax=Coemansia javaensis TaxID=2761396 RepID=A0A9W8LJE0_9FUNG|nr:RNA-binding RNA processing protein rpp1 [Coemansia javaensis]